MAVQKGFGVTTSYADGQVKPYYVNEAQWESSKRNLRSKANLLIASSDLTGHQLSKRWLYEKALFLGYTPSDSTPTLESLNTEFIAFSVDMLVSNNRTLYGSVCANKQSCRRTKHEISVDIIRNYAEVTLQMLPPGIKSDQIFRVEIPVEVIKEVIVEKEVTKIVEKEVIKIVKQEIPIALSFETKEILTNALHREHAIIKEQIRLAYLDNSEGRAGVFVGRLKALEETMVQFGIPLDPYANSKAWLMDYNFNQPLMEDNQVVAFPLEDTK